MFISYSPSSFLFGLLAGRNVSHVALNEDASHFLLAVGENLDALLEASWHLVGTVVGDRDFARCTRGDEVLGVFSHGASTGGVDSRDDQFGITHVGELEGAFANGLIQGEGTHVNRGLLELDLWILLGLQAQGHGEQGHEQQ